MSGAGLTVAADGIAALDAFLNERLAAQVAAQYQRRVESLESADLRHAGGYALKLRGVTTTAGAEGAPAVRR